MDLFLATSSSHKVQELQSMLKEADININVYPADQAGGMPLVEETESTLEGNARLKAQALKAILPQDAWVLADDSGLFVDALDGAPGVHSARFSGPDATDQQNRTKLLKSLEGVKEDQRSARFLCCFVLLHPGVQETVFLASVQGIITMSEQGKKGFGYDPIFIANGQTKTFAEIDPDLKNKISHRGHAIKELVEWARNRF